MTVPVDEVVVRVRWDQTDGFAVLVDRPGRDPLVTFAKTPGGALGVALPAVLDLQETPRV